MEGEEPTAGLVDALGDEVGREKTAAVKAFFVLEGVMDLGVGHGAGVEPNVDKVGLAVHGASGG